MINMNIVEAANRDAIEKVLSSLEYFKGGFPGPQSNGYVYEVRPHGAWTEGFYTGELMLAYEHTKRAELLPYIESQIDSFKNRIENKYAVDHHDLGFLYSLSCVAAYKVLNSNDAKNAAIKAADYLLTRFQEKGEFIQAWGELGAADQYRLIIDCMLNLPLLYWASEVTDNDKYKEIALKHANTCMSVIIRPDNTTFHTYYFDPESGKPLKGVTHQGYSDDSCWARGQAWGIYGIALQHSYTRDETIIPLYNRLVEYFITHLGPDAVPYWDLCFTDGDEPRDTSAAAIAICGIYEMSKYIKDTKHMEKADRMLESLIKNYTTKNIPYSNGLLTDAMYNRPAGHASECNIWGDYFYMEALMRKLHPEWNMYW